MSSSDDIDEIKEMEFDGILVNVDFEISDIKERIKTPDDAIFVIEILRKIKKALAPPVVKLPKTAAGEDVEHLIAEYAETNAAKIEKLKNIRREVFKSLGADAKLLNSVGISRFGDDKILMEIGFEDDDNPNGIHADQTFIYSITLSDTDYLVYSDYLQTKLVKKFSARTPKKLIDYLTREIHNKLQRVKTTHKD
jgi:hypothetical protein